MDPEHPCKFLLGKSRVQGPDCSLPGLFLRIVFSASNPEGRSIISPMTKDRLSFHLLKKLNLPSSVFLCGNEIHYVSIQRWSALCVAPRKFGAGELLQTNMNVWQLLLL